MPSFFLILTALCLLCMGALSAYMLVRHMHAVPGGRKGELDPLRATGVKGGPQFSYRSWESKPGPREEQPALLAAEPSLQSFPRDFWVQSWDQTITYSRYVLHH